MRLANCLLSLLHPSGGHDGRRGCRYVPDALSTVRAVVSNDWDALYVFQLQMAESPGSRIPNIHQGGEVEYGNVDSGNGSGSAHLTLHAP